MPTLEDRLEALERALSILQSERISDQRQFDEHKRRLAGQEQGMQYINQSFDGLKKALNVQFNAIDAHYTRLGQQQDQLFVDIIDKFDGVNDVAITTWKGFQKQERDIREIKGRLERVDDRISSVLHDIAELDIKFDHQSKQLNQQGQDIKSLSTRLDEQGQDIKSLSTRLDEQGQDIKALSVRLDEQGQQLSQQGQDIKSLSTRLDEQGQDIKDLHGKFDHQEKLLLQILDRLPSP